MEKGGRTIRESVWQTASTVVCNIPGFSCLGFWGERGEERFKSWEIVAISFLSVKTLFEIPNRERKSRKEKLEKPIGACQIEVHSLLYPVIHLTHVYILARSFFCVSGVFVLEAV